MKLYKFLDVSFTSMLMSVLDQLFLDGIRELMLKRVLIVPLSLIYNFKQVQMQLQLGMLINPSLISVFFGGGGRDSL